VPDELTDLLRAWSRGEQGLDQGAAAEVYTELRRRARGRLRGERQRATLSTTDLVHEMYVRLSRQHVTWLNREQFYAAASLMMRRVLVDHARTRLARKRAGVHLELTDDLASSAPCTLDILAIDEALAALALHDPRQAQLVELRFFGGLTLEEAASALSISLPTANRDWRFARAWLALHLGTGKDTPT